MRTGGAVVYGEARRPGKSRRGDTQKGILRPPAHDEGSLESGGCRISPSVPPIPDEGITAVDVPVEEELSVITHVVGTVLLKAETVSQREPTETEDEHTHPQDCDHSIPRPNPTIVDTVSPRKAVALVQLDR